MPTLGMGELVSNDLRSTLEEEIQLEEKRSKEAARPLIPRPGNYAYLAGGTNSISIENRTSSTPGTARTTAPILCCTVALGYGTPRWPALETRPVSVTTPSLTSTVISCPGTSAAFARAAWTRAVSTSSDGRCVAWDAQPPTAAAATALMTSAK